MTEWYCQFSEWREQCTASNPHGAPAGCAPRRVADLLPHGVFELPDGTYMTKGRNAEAIGWDWTPHQGLGWHNGPGTRRAAWYEVRPPETR